MQYEVCFINNGPQDQRLVISGVSLRRSQLAQVTIADELRTTEVHEAVIETVLKLEEAANELRPLAKKGRNARRRFWEARRAHELAQSLLCEFQDAIGWFETAEFKAVICKIADNCVAQMNQAAA